MKALTHACGLWYQNPDSVAKDVCVCETICVSNTGAGSKSVIMKRLSIEAGKNTFSGLREEDAMCLKNAAKKIQAKYRNRRRRLRFEKKKRTPKEVVYKAGSFGVGIEQETGRKSSKGKKKVQWKSKKPANAGGKVMTWNLQTMKFYL